MLTRTSEVSYRCSQEGNPHTIDIRAIADFDDVIIRITPPVHELRDTLEQLALAAQDDEEREFKYRVFGSTPTATLITCAGEKVVGGDALLRTVCGQMEKLLTGIGLAASQELFDECTDIPRGLGYY